MILDNSDVVAKLGEMVGQNIVYYDSNEMGEIFITVDDLFDQVKEIKEDGCEEVSLYADIFISGDPMKETYLDFNTPESFLDFLNQFE